MNDDDSKVIRIVPRPVKDQQAAADVLNTAAARLITKPASGVIVLTVYEGDEVTLEASSGVSVREILGALQMGIQAIATKLQPRPT